MWGFDEELIQKVVCFILVVGNVTLMVMAVKGRLGEWSNFFIGAPFVLIIATSIISLVLGRRRRASLLLRRAQEQADRRQQDDEELKEEILRILFPGNRIDEESSVLKGSGVESGAEDDGGAESAAGSVPGDGGGVPCPICLEPIVPGDLVVSGASCDHVFHRPCVFQWLMKKNRDPNEDHNTCPTCRSPMWTGQDYENAETEARKNENKVQKEEDNNDRTN